MIHGEKKVAVKIAYMMSRFPKVTETFVLYEILEIESQDIPIEIFPILQEKESVMHPEAETLTQRAHYHKVLSQPVLAAQLHWLLKKPIEYLAIWFKVLIGNLPSPEFLARALVIMPLAALFAKKMEELEITHIHAHFATHPLLGAYIIHQLTNIPYSVTAHAHDIYVNRTMLEPKLKDASFIVAISDYNRRLLSELYGSEVANKIEVIHCGIDPDFFKPREQVESNDEFMMVCVGSLSEYKGQRYLVEACKQLKSDGIKFRCLLIGEGDGREEIEQLIVGADLQSEVELSGRQPRQFVSDMLAKADVMVLPSVVTSTGKKEGIPVALMEAMATQIPVVSTQISGIPELIENGVTGWLVPERDADALTQALVEVYENPALAKQLAQQGREKVLREFNLITNSKTLSNLFVTNLIPDTTSIAKVNRGQI